MDEKKEGLSGVGKIIGIAAAVLLVLLLVLFLWNRSRKNDTPAPVVTTTQNTPTSAPTTPTTPTSATGTNSMTDKGELGSQTVEIKSKQLVKDENGKDAIIITYSVTNNGNAAMNFLTMLHDTVYQGTEKLNDAVLRNIEDFNADSIRFDIKKGESYTVQKAFILKDLQTPVKIEVKQVSATDARVVTKTFDIN